MVKLCPSCGVASPQPWGSQFQMLELISLGCSDAGIYAASFFAIPLVRWFFIRKRNADIEKRNQVREKYARELESPELSLRRKLLSARNMAQRTVIGQDRIVYSSNRDLLEQDLEGQDWDRRFREIKKNSD